MRLETGLEASSSGAEGGVAEVQGVGEQSLERKPSRTLYLMVKKDRTENSWQFRTFLSLPSYATPTNATYPHVYSARRSRRERIIARSSATRTERRGRDGH